jgi:uncharacterized membrane protein YuzA (DUF378 family)
MVTSPNEKRPPTVTSFEQESNLSTMLYAITGIAAITIVAIAVAFVSRKIYVKNRTT